jgi:hypothetical protein
MQKTSIIDCCLRQRRYIGKSVLGLDQTILPFLSVLGIDDLLLLASTAGLLNSSLIVGAVVHAGARCYSYRLSTQRIIMLTITH